MASSLDCLVEAYPLKRSPGLRTRPAQEIPSEAGRLTGLVGQRGALDDQADLALVLFSTLQPGPADTHLTVLHRPNSDLCCMVSFCMSGANTPFRMQ